MRTCWASGVLILRCCRCLYFVCCWVGHCSGVNFSHSPNATSMDPSSDTTTQVPTQQHTAQDATGLANVDTPTLTTDVDANLHKGPLLSDEFTYTAVSPTSVQDTGRGTMSHKDFVKSTQSPSMDQQMTTLFPQLHDADPPIATEQRRPVLRKTRDNANASRITPPSTIAPRLVSDPLSAEKYLWILHPSHGHAVVA